jgi:hypothetical protein
VGTVIFTCGSLSSMALSNWASAPLFFSAIRPVMVTIGGRLVFPVPARRWCAVPAGSQQQGVAGIGHGVFLGGLNSHKKWKLQKIHY